MMENDFRRFKDFDPLAIEVMVEEMEKILNSNGWDKIAAMKEFRSRHGYTLEVAHKVLQEVGENKWK